MSPVGPTPKNSTLDPGLELENIQPAHYAGHRFGQYCDFGV
jgi:hypothetical protein